MKHVWSKFTEISGYCKLFGIGNALESLARNFKSVMTKLLEFSLFSSLVEGNKIFRGSQEEMDTNELAIQFCQISNK